MRALLLAVLLLVTASCSDTEALPIADGEVKKFHQAFNDGRFGEIYDKSAAEFRQSSREDFVLFMQTLQRKLGKTGETKRVNFSLNSSSAGVRVTLIYETSFADGKGLEKFNYLVANKKAVLVGYRLDSKDLLLK